MHCGHARTHACTHACTHARTHAFARYDCWPSGHDCLQANRRPGRQAGRHTHLSWRLVVLEETMKGVVLNWERERYY